MAKRIGSAVYLSFSALSHSQGKAAFISYDKGTIWHCGLACEGRAKVVFTFKDSLEFHAQRLGGGDGNAEVTARLKRQLQQSKELIDEQITSAGCYSSGYLLLNKDELGGAHLVRLHMLGKQTDSNNVPESEREEMDGFVDVPLDWQGKEIMSQGLIDSIHAPGPDGKPRKEQKQAPQSLFDDSNEDETDADHQKDIEEEDENVEEDDAEAAGVPTAGAEMTSSCIANTQAYGLHPTVARGRVVKKASSGGNPIQKNSATSLRTSRYDVASPKSC
eukprot:g43952.t1